jgi:hypothetical protein
MRQLSPDRGIGRGFVASVERDQPLPATSVVAGPWSWSGRPWVVASGLWTSVARAPERRVGAV